MTAPLSSAEVAEAKKLEKRATAFSVTRDEYQNPMLQDERGYIPIRNNQIWEWIAAARTLVPRLIATIEAKDADLAAAVKERDELGGSELNWREYAEKLERDLESERAARQEAERMLAEADCCIAVDWTERKFDELSRFENEATYRHRARQAKGEGGQR